VLLSRLGGHPAEETEDEMSQCSLASAYLEHAKKIKVYSQVASWRMCSSVSAIGQNRTSLTRLEGHCPANMAVELKRLG